MHRRGLTIVEMAIVLFIMSLMLVIIFSLVRTFSVFKTTQDEAEILKDMYLFAKRSAVKSGQLVYMDFNIDENKYIIYRKERKDELKDQVLVERNLFFTNKIVYIKLYSGKKIDNGKVTLYFYPQGFNDEVYIYLGSQDNIKKTIIFPRYGRYGIIKGGEYEGMDTPEKILEEDKGGSF